MVVGAGVAGLSAALFLGRAGRSTLVYDGGRPRIFAVEKVRELLGFDGMPVSQFMERAREEVLRYGVDIRQERVEKIVPRADGLFDVLGASDTVIARTVVLATGVTDELPPLAGLPSAWGRDVRVCPCFDGHEVMGKRFVVFGVPERLAHMATCVSAWSDDVTIVSRHAFSAEESERLALLDIGIVHDEVAGLIHEEGALIGIRTASGRELPCDATWIAAHSRAASSLAASLCEVDALGLAVTDKAGRTSRPGVYAVGNASDASAHLAHAIAAGTHVGPFVTTYLLEQRLAELKTAGGGAAASERQ